MTPSLFEEPAAAVPAAIVRKANETHALAPYFDELTKLLGAAVVLNCRGRVAQIASRMRKAGLRPEQIAGIPLVVGRWAGWRGVVDVSAVQECWPWLLDAPVTVEPVGAATLAADAIRGSGGKIPL